MYISIFTSVVLLSTSCTFPAVHPVFVVGELLLLCSLYLAMTKDSVEVEYVLIGAGLPRTGTFSTFTGEIMRYLSLPLVNVGEETSNIPQPWRRCCLVVVTTCPVPSVTRHLMNNCSGREQPRVRSLTRTGKSSSEPAVCPPQWTSLCLSTGGTWPGSTPEPRWC